MATLASLLVKLGVDTRGVKGDLDKGTKDAEESGKKSGKKFSSGFKTTVKAGLVAGAALAATFVAGQIGDAISAASDLNETISKTQQIFGPAAAEVQSFSDTAATALGQSRQQAMDAAATFGVFGKSAGLTGGQLAGFSTEMVGLASDLASFGNTTPQEAIDALGAALRGESEPIRKYGILLDDATLRQHALELGLIKTTKDALTPQQKVLAAQAAILEQTSDAQGDFARTSDGLANKQRIQEAQTANLRAELGEKLLPIQLKFTELLSKTATFVADNIRWITPLAAVIGALILVVKIATAVQILWNSALFANPIGLVILAIIALIAIVVLVVKHWDTVRAAFAVAWNWIWERLKAFGSWFMSVFWTNGLQRGFRALGAILGWVRDQFVAGFQRAQRTGQTVIGWVMGIPGLISRAFRGLFNIIIWPFRTAFNFISDAWNNTVGRLSWTVPRWVPFIGGNRISVPNLPRYHGGGLLPGTGEQVVVARGGEGIFTPEQMRAMSPAQPPSRGDRGDRLVLDLTGADEEMKRLVRKWIRADNLLQDA